MLDDSNIFNDQTRQSPGPDSIQLGSIKGNKVIDLSSITVNNKPVQKKETVDAFKWHAVQRFESFDDLMQYYQDEQHCQFKISDELPPSTPEAYMNISTDQNTKFFIRILFWHMLFYCTHIISLPFMLIFEGRTATKNLGFWSWTANRDQMMSISLIGCTTMYILYQKELHLPVVILIIAWYNIIFRSFKIAARYMFMTYRRYLFWKTGKVSNETVIDDLLIGWMNAYPKLIDREIYFCMQRENMEDCTFHFSCVTKMDKDMHDYLRNPDKNDNDFNEHAKVIHYQKQMILLKQHIGRRFQIGDGVCRDTNLNEAAKIDDHVQKHLTEYNNLQKAMFQIPSLKETFTNYSSRKFVRLIIEGSIASIPIKPANFQTIMTQFLTAFLIPIVIEIVTDCLNLDSRHVDELGDPLDDLSDVEFGFKKWQFWTYLVFSMPINIVLCTVNAFFLDSVAVSYQRRSYLMKTMSSMLEFNVYQKPDQHQFIPTLNFIDPTSLIAWNNMRSLVKETGNRYFIRMDFYMIVYIFLVAMNYIYLICYGFNYLPDDLKAPLPELLSIQIYFLQAVFNVVSLLNTAAYLNEETEEQIIKINNLRGMLHEVQEFTDVYLEYYFRDEFDEQDELNTGRSQQKSKTKPTTPRNAKKSSVNPAPNSDWVNDPSIDQEEKDFASEIKKNKPLTIINPGTYSALKYYKNYRKIFGQEKADELLASALSRCEFILDFLDKDLTYSPVKVFGFALSPEFLTQLYALTFSILLSYFQQEMLKWQKAKAAAEAGTSTTL